MSVFLPTKTIVSKKYNALKKMFQFQLIEIQ